MQLVCICLFANLLFQGLEGERQQPHEGSAAAAAAALQEKYVAWQQRLDSLITKDAQVVRTSQCNRLP